MRPGENDVDKAHEKAILEKIWPPNATKVYRGSQPAGINNECLEVPFSITAAWLYKTGCAIEAGPIFPACLLKNSVKHYYPYAYAI